MKSSRATALALAALFVLPVASAAQSARIGADDVNLRDAPGPHGATIANLERGRPVRVEGSSGDWVHVRLGSGAHGWVRRDFVAVGGASAARPGAPPAEPTPAPSTPPPASAAERPAAPDRPAHASPPNAASPQQSETVSPALAGTRPDPLAETQDDTAGLIVSGFRFLLYLLPVLALVVGALWGMKYLQQRYGGGLTADGANLSPGASRPGRPSPIRVTGSARLGATTLHLVEVRGRLLLLGNGPSGVQTLADLGAARDHFNEEFQALLNEAAVAQAPPSRDRREPTVQSVVSGLDSALRQARQTLGQSANRVRQSGPSVRGQGRQGGLAR